MNLIRKAFTTLGGVFLAALLIAALAPRATRGVAAALVQVTNTASNPVPTEDGPGNFPFDASVCAETGGTFCGGLTEGFFVPLTTSTGAAVKRLVIEDVSSTCDVQPGDVVSTEIDVRFPADNVDLLNRGIFRHLFPVTFAGPDFGVVHSPARIYVDAGAPVSAMVVGVVATKQDVDCTMYLSGHLETK
jgi:hypothetical protein